jgi:hypothetical protein
MGSRESAVNGQLPFDFSQALARHSDPSTSHLAAALVNVEDRERVILDALREVGSRGATCNELGAILQLPRDSVSPRMRPMVKKNWVKDSGMRRLTSANREAIVWTLIDTAP